MLGGSHVNFRKRERSPLSEQENELRLENERRLQEGIVILRKFRTQALADQDFAECQSHLRKAHQFSSRMADVILDQAISEKPTSVNPDFLETLRKMRDDYQDTGAGSAHDLPPQFSIGNLFRAVDDMLVRVEEKCQSLKNPNHRLTEEETRYVLQEFLLGTNDLSVNAIKKFFLKNTKIGGILSGGSVYVEVVKKLVERYSDQALTVNTFAIAVDKEKKKAVFESDDADDTMQTVVVVDDMIDKGGTILTALWAVGEQFPNATIYSGKGTDQPGGFEERRIRKHMTHLSVLFQDFADFSEAGRNDEALMLFEQAEQYAKSNGVLLQNGWYKRKERIEKLTGKGGGQK